MNWGRRVLAVWWVPYWAKSRNVIATLLSTFVADFTYKTCRHQNGNQGGRQKYLQPYI